MKLLKCELKCRISFNTRTPLITVKHMIWRTIQTSRTHIYLPPTPSPNRVFPSCVRALEHCLSSNETMCFKSVFSCVWLFRSSRSKYIHLICVWMMMREREIVRVQCHPWPCRRVVTTIHVVHGHMEITHYICIVEQRHHDLCIHNKIYYTNDNIYYICLARRIYGEHFRSDI